MKILDRYIMKQFIVNFAILTAVFMMLFVLVDMIVDLDEFLAAGQRRAQMLAQGNTPSTQTDALTVDKPEPNAWHLTLGIAWTVGDYYGPMVLLVYTFLSGLLVTAAMGFTLTALARNREIIAVISSGVSMFRIAAPVVVVGCVLNMLTLPIQEWLIPPVKEKLARSKSRMKSGGVQTFDFHLVPDGHGNLISAAAFNPTENELTDVLILVRDDLGRTVRHITAKTAFWNRDHRRWDLLHAHEASGSATGAMPVDYYETDLTPEALMARHRAIYPRLLSLEELQELRDDPTVGALQIMHSRFSLLAANVLVLIMGLPYFMLLEPKNMLTQAIKAACVCIGAWASGLVMLQMSSTLLPPVAMAWLPVAIYLPVSAFVLQTVRT